MIFSDEITWETLLRKIDENYNVNFVDRLGIVDFKHVVNGIAKLTSVPPSRQAYIFDTDKESLEFYQAFAAFHDFGQYSLKFPVQPNGKYSTGLVKIDEFSLEEIAKSKNHKATLAKVEEKSKLFSEIALWNARFTLS